MCGIVGFSKADIQGSELVESLAHLTYRGYDSSGVAFMLDEGIASAKAPGSIEAIAEKAQRLRGSAAIGHTRWATHGTASQINAHPQTFKTFAIVHNGIVDNYVSLKNQFQSLGFQSETDTEILLRIYSIHRGEGMSPIESIKTLMQQVRGNMSFALIDEAYPNSVFAVRKELPLVVGKLPDGSIVASDPIALPKNCLELLSVPDHCMAHLRNGEVEFIPLVQGVIAFPSKLAMEQKKEVRQLKNSDNHMIHEIHEQPKIIKSLLKELIHQNNQEIDQVKVGVSGLNLGKICHIQIIGCGSAFYTGLLGKNFLEEYTTLPISIELASEFRYSKRIISPKTLLIAISQSGETADVLACVKMAKQQNCQILAFCNRTHSELARLATKTIDLQCGSEISVASTKAVLSMGFCQYLFALGCGRNRGLLSKLDEREKLSELRHLPGQLNQVLAMSDQIEALSHQLIESKSMLFLGRRNCFPIALEGALKVKELSYIQAEGYSAGELKHGPLALVTEKTVVVGILAMDEVREKTIANLIETKARNAKVLLITNLPRSDWQQIAEDAVEIPCKNATNFLFLATVACQLISYHLANKLGLSVDRPRNLAKSVTVE